MELQPISTILGPSAKSWDLYVRNISSDREKGIAAYNDGGSSEGLGPHFWSLYILRMTEAVSVHVIWTADFDVFMIVSISKSLLSTSRYVEAHQLRTVADAALTGLPTPEGVHTDGRDHVFMLLSGRSESQKFYIRAHTNKNEKRKERQKRHDREI